MGLRSQAAFQEAGLCRRPLHCVHAITLRTQARAHTNSQHVRKHVHAPAAQIADSPGNSALPATWDDFVRRMVSFPENFVIQRTRDSNRSPPSQLTHPTLRSLLLLLFLFLPIQQLEQPSALPPQLAHSPPRAPQPLLGVDLARAAATTTPGGLGGIHRFQL